VQPPEFVATIFHLLGIAPGATFPDRTGRPMPVAHGEPLWDLLGTKPATLARTEPGGDVALVPPFDNRQVRDEGFESGTLNPHGSRGRTKTWQAAPLVADGGGFGVRLVNDPANARGGNWHAALGIGDRPAGELVIAEGMRAMLTQEVRNPMAGNYSFAVHACGGGESAEAYRELLAHFAVRLAIFGFVDLAKHHGQQRIFATTEIQPSYSPGSGGYERFEVTVNLKSQDNGANQTDYGIGVGVFLEKRTPGPLTLPAGTPGAYIRVDDVAFRFSAEPLKKEVVI
jgi:hypothetical protein